ncbi:MAG: universal stress protein [Alphaproteobacteria bacterium]|nr:MAG: universal stress protein [Alphaproteobacteria bacterium]
MTQLLALIDGSIYADSVCDLAAWAAKRLDANIRLLHVLGRNNPGHENANLSGSIGLGARTALLTELAEHDEQAAKLSLERGRLLLDGAMQHLADAGIAGATGKLRHGDLVEAVQDFEDEADLIVIGKRGEAADFARLHLGSNLERVVRSAHRPVLVAARAFKPISRFILAFDGGDSAKKAVEHVASSPLFSGLACSLVMVGSETADARAALVAATNRLTDAGIMVDASFEKGDPEEAIKARVEEDGATLLVMGAYGHSRIRNLIIGSTTSEMVRSCLVPVMLFR